MERVSRRFMALATAPGNDDPLYRKLSSFPLVSAKQPV